MMQEGRGWARVLALTLEHTSAREQAQPLEETLVQVQAQALAMLELGALWVPVQLPVLAQGLA